MAKPICLIKIDDTRVRFGGTLAPIYEIQRVMDDRLTDYHVLVVPFEQIGTESFEPFQIQVFHERNFTEIQYKELREMIETCLNPV